MNEYSRVKYNSKMCFLLDSEWSWTTDKMLFLAVLGSSLVLASAQHGCPEPYGVQTYPDEKYCDRFYKVSYIDWNWCKPTFISTYLNSSKTFDGDSFSWERGASAGTEIPPITRFRMCRYFCPVWLTICDPYTFDSFCVWVVWEDSPSSPPTQTPI